MKMQNKMMAGLLAMIAMLFALHLSAAPADEGWELARERDGISVYTREVAGSKFKEFRGETVIDAELNQLMAMLDDTVAIAEWMYNAKDPQLLQKVSLLDRYQYLVNDFPWPAGDRDMIIRNLIDQDTETRVTTIKLMGVEADKLPEKARAAAPEPGDYVRVTDIDGFIRLTPLDDKRTRVVYQLHLDPVGSLPAKLVNALIVDNPYESLKSMREVVKRPEYRCFKPF